MSMQAEADATQTSSSAKSTHLRRKHNMHQPIDWEKEVQDTRIAATAAARSAERTIAAIAEALSLFRGQQTANATMKCALATIDSRLGQLEVAQHNKRPCQTNLPSSHKRTTPALLWVIGGAFIGAAFAAFFMS